MITSCGFTRCARLILQKYKLAVMEEGLQVVRIVRYDSVLEQVIDIYMDQSFSLRKKPSIHFEGEVGYDASGLTRDFFSSTMSRLYGEHSGFFEGVIPTNNMQLVLSGKFKAVGRFFAHSFLHGGPSGCLCDVILDVMIRKDINAIEVPFTQIVSPSVKKLVLCLKEVNEETDLASIDSILVNPGECINNYTTYLF